MNWDDINNIKRKQEQRRNENIIASDEKISEVIKSAGFKELMTPHLNATEGMIFKMKTELTASGLDGIEHNLFLYKLKDNFFTITPTLIENIPDGVSYVSFNFTATIIYENGQTKTEDINCLGMIYKTNGTITGIVEDPDIMDFKLNASDFKFVFNTNGTWGGTFIAGRKDLAYINGTNFNFVVLGTLNTVTRNVSDNIDEELINTEK